MSSDEQTKAGNLVIEGDLITGGFKMATGAGADKVLTTDASGIASWQTPAGGSLWTQTGSDIYYNTGNVGIGDTTPTSKLDVAGSITSTYTADTAGIYSVGPSGNTHIPYTNGAVYLSGNNIYFRSSTNATRMTILDGGNVGIGTTDPQTKLDVAGAIKIGTQSTCDANSAGAIRYDSTAKQFYGCTGTSWKSLESCGYAVTFTYKGTTVTYGTVYSPATGRCWMDRNLGASQVATAYNDSNAYGDLFQWGRLDDGHQTRTSGTTTTLSSTDNPGHSNFIYGMGSPYDWRSPQNNNLWQGVSGINNPCPSGWRLPTYTEWDTERASWSQQNYSGAFASPLKLPVAFYRTCIDASIVTTGLYSYYWSSTVSDTYSGYLMNGSTMGMNYSKRAHGFSVRCIKD